MSLKGRGLDQRRGVDEILGRDGLHVTGADRSDTAGHGSAGAGTPGKAQQVTGASGA